MCTLRNLKLLTCGPVDVDRSLLSLLFPEVHDQLLNFVKVEGEIIFPRHHSARALTSSL
jgi:hypothetical protein